MRFIVQNIETHQHYVVNTETGHLEWMGTEEKCREYIKYLVFRDFYYSVKDLQGRDHIPAVTLDYREVMDTPSRNTASGWWDDVLYRDTSFYLNNQDLDRFWLCYRTTCAPTS